MDGNYVIGPEYKTAPERKVVEGVPQGKVQQFTIDSKETKLFNPGIARKVFGKVDPKNPKTLIVETHTIDYKRQITVYVPAQYKASSDAPFMIIHDGPQGKPNMSIPQMLDNLIAQKRVPPIVAIMVANGGGDAQGHERGKEYDTMSGMFADYIEAEVLPRVEKNCEVKLTKDPDGRAAMGNSSGGSAALIMAWYRANLYHRVLTTSGTFVNQQWPFNPETPGGAWDFHETIIPNSPKKPLRIFISVGDRDLLNPNVMRDGMHDWVEANHRMAKVLKAKGYAYQYLFCRNAGHSIGNAQAQFLPHAIEWVWRGYAAKKGVSGQPINLKQDMRSIERPNPSWDYDGKRILGHVGQTVILWDATTGKVLQKLPGHKERIFAVRFSPDGVHALSSCWVPPGGMLNYKSKDTRTLLWNLTTGEQKADLPDQVASEFSPDGKRIVTFSLRPKELSWFDAVVWDAAKGVRIAEAKLEDASRPDHDTLHFAPDGASFAHIMGGVGGLLLVNPSFGVLYDARTGREIGRSPLKKGRSTATGGHRYTSNGTLVSFEGDRVMLTDLKAGRIQSIPHGLKRSYQGYYAAWTHDGKKVAALPGNAGKIEIWDVESRKASVGARSHPKQGPGDKLIVSPDNKRLAIDSGYNVEDPDLRLYDMNTGKEIAQIKLAEWGHVIGFSPDSKTILVGGREFVIYDSENGKQIRSFKLLDDVSFSHDWNR